MFEIDRYTVTAVNIEDNITLQFSTIDARTKLNITNLRSGITYSFVVHSVAGEMNKSSVIPSNEVRGSTKQTSKCKQANSLLVCIYSYYNNYYY